MNKTAKKVILFAAASLAGMYAYNQYVEATSQKKNKLTTKDGKSYAWKEGNIFYTKQGQGSPLLLIHDATPTSCGYEWNRVVRRFSKNHTVYTIDLLGCGRSQKPAFQYTNFLYVQMISDFIKDVIGSKTDVIASNMSTSFILMANRLNEELFDHIILVNPVSPKKLEVMPDDLSKVKKAIINLPVVGTFVFNLLASPLHLESLYRKNYFGKSFKLSNSDKETIYEGTVSGQSRSKYLYSSLLGNYMNSNIRLALKKTKTPMLLLGGSDCNNIQSIMEEYHKYNNKFQSKMIAGTKMYPQIEAPNPFEKLVEDYLNK